MNKIYVINGPNINFLGVRQKAIYGNDNYCDLCNYIKNEAIKYNVEVEIYQSNSEGEIIDIIQKSYEETDGLIINPGAYTHYSYAILDALQSINKPVVEVHLTNIHSREKFRRKSVTAEACIGQISGFGFLSYGLGIQALVSEIIKK